MKRRRRSDLFFTESRTISSDGIRNSENRPKVNFILFITANIYFVFLKKEALHLVKTTLGGYCKDTFFFDF